MSIVESHSVDLKADASIVVALHGELDHQCMEQIVKRTELLASGLSEQGFPVLILIDVHRLEQYTDDAMALILDWLARGRFDKMAIVGSDLLEKIMGTVTAKVIHREIQFFDNLEMGSEWLKLN